MSRGLLRVVTINSPLGKGSCEKIESRLLPALSVRRGTAVSRARSTQVERALRARFHLWIRRRNGSGLAQFNFSQLQGVVRTNEDPLPQKTRRTFLKASIPLEKWDKRRNSKQHPDVATLAARTLSGGLRSLASFRSVPPPATAFDTNPRSSHPA